MSLNLRPHCVLAVAAVLALASAPLHALTFNVTYDASTATAPAGFFTAVNYAVQGYQNKFHDPISINLQVGWGAINGQPLNPGSRAEAAAFKLPYSYTQLRNALIADAKSAADVTSIAGLPITNPTGNVNDFVVSRAEAKALGLLPAHDANIHPTKGALPDLYIGVDAIPANYNFDTVNRAVAGKHDFVGIIEHEIAQGIGRFGQSQNGLPLGWYSPLDLFRYTSAGTHDLSLSSPAYFSIDGGNTVINTFNTSGVGDRGDWAVSTFDAFNYTSTAGQMHAVSPGDIIEMDVLGYDTVVPEPTGVSLLVLGLSAVLARRRKSVTE